MTDDDKKLVEMLRDDDQYILVEGHNVTDWDSIEAQRFEAADRIEALIAENERLRDLLRRNIDPDPCRLDHHGYCQTHYLEKNCSVAAARAALGDTK